MNNATGAGMFIPAFPPLTLPRAGDPRDASRAPALPDGQLFVRGRHALRHGLAVLAAKRQLRRVWLPAYLVHCVIEAVEAAGLSFCRYDVDEGLEPRGLDELPLCAGDALLVVHYFGLAQPVERLLALCQARALLLVEDCAHVVRDPGAGVMLGSYGAISVFSPRKQLAVPGGGLLVSNDPACAPAPAPPAFARADLRTVLKLGLMGVERLAVALGVNLLRLKDRLPVLDAYRQASADTAARAAADAGPPSRLVARLLRTAAWQAQIAARQDAYARLVDALREVRGITVPVALPRRGSVPLSVPVWVSDPDGFCRRLRRRGIEAMRWPGREQTPFDAAAYPGAALWRDRTVCLPLGVPLSPARTAHVVTAVEHALAPGAARARRRVTRV